MPHYASTETFLDIIELVDCIMNETCTGRVDDASTANIMIKGNTVSIISDLDGLEAAKVAVSMVLAGSEHGSVYKYLESFRRKNH